MHRDGVDAEELRRVGLAVLLLANIGLERAVEGPLEPPPLSGKGWTTHLVRQVAHLAAIFDLLAQSTSHKTAWGDCSLVCDSSIGPISFCSSALFIANLCWIGDHVLELACQIYMVPSSSNA